MVENLDGKLKLNAKAARLLYAGIVGDTGRFMSIGIWIGPLVAMDNDRVILFDLC